MMMTIKTRELSRPASKSATKYAQSKVIQALAPLGSGALESQFGVVNLYTYLVDEIFPQLAPPPYGEIEAISLSQQKPVYLFRERSREIAVVGKLFRYNSIPLDEAWLHAQREYANLMMLRDECGMNDGAYSIVAPLGRSRELSALLVTEKAPGRPLDDYIAGAAYTHSCEALFDKLSHLAVFLVKLHRCGNRSGPVSLSLPQLYLSKLLNSLIGHCLTSHDRERIEKYACDWWDRAEILLADHEVIVHGDATPTNFFFDEQKVIAIDLERMKWADRCWDLGFIAAELKHHFLWRTGNVWDAEPFIGHFIWQYATCYADTRFFYDITRKIPLYMALGLLRIARNDWLDAVHRKGLIREARRCLKYGL